MDAEIGQLVYSAANTVVGAMASDGWDTVRGRLSRWFTRHRQSSAGAESVMAKLEELRGELVRAQQGGGSGDAESFRHLYEALQVALTLRLAEVIAADPEARAELERLGAEWLTLPGVSAGSAGSAANVAREYLELLADPRVISRARGAAPTPPRLPAASGPRTIPNLAPPTSAHFIDREELLARLQAWIVRLEGRTRIVNLWGEGGIGKSAFAAKLWETVSSSFPHGLLYADLRGTTGEGAVDPSSALTRFLRALGVAASDIPGDEEAQLDAYRMLTADLGLVVLLDDAASVAQVRPLISASPNSLTIVTSRDPLRGLVEQYGAAIERIPALDAANSLRLLRAVAGLEDDAAAATDLDARAVRCAGLPIALCVEGARYAIGEDADELPESQGLDLLAAYQSLPPDLVRLHRLLCTEPWPSITAGPASAVAGVDEGTAGRMLDRLYLANLLERAPGNTAASPRYRVHDLVREEANRRALTEDGPREIVAAARAVVSWYLAYAVLADWQVIARWHLGPRYAPLDERRSAAVRAGVPTETAYASDTDALDAIETELDNLIEAARVAERHLFYDLVTQLCESLWSVFLRRGHHQEWITVHRLGVTAAAATGDRRMESRMRVQLAFGLMGQDRLAEADEQFGLGLEAARAAGHDQSIATALESLGLLRLNRGDFERAAELLAEARVFAERAGDPRALALLEHHFGRALSGLGRFDEATGQFDRAFAAFQELKTRDEYNEGRILMSRAENALRAGRPALAREVLDDAARIMDARGSLVQQAQVAVLRAWCARESGDLVAERAFLVEAAALHARAGSRAAPRVTERIAFLDAAVGRLR